MLQLAQRGRARIRGVAQCYVQIRDGRYLGGKVDEMTIAKWAIQICDVLHYIHSQTPPIIYRDLKPANLMLDDKSSRVMLVDFGIARIVRPTEKGVTAIGTMGYAPPELFGGKVEPRSDIYSLGATMFHMMTGSDPQDNPLLIFDFSKNPRPRQINPAITPEMEQILTKAVAHKPEERHASALDLKGVLEEQGARLVGRRASNPAARAIPSPTSRTADRKAVEARSPSANHPAVPPPAPDVAPVPPPAAAPTPSPPPRVRIAAKRETPAPAAGGWLPLHALWLAALVWSFVYTPVALGVAVGSRSVVRTLDPIAGLETIAEGGLRYATALGLCCMVLIVRFVLGASGHIAGVINPADKGKRSYWVGEPYPEDPEAWFAKASEKPGSWWTEWARWIEEHKGGVRAAPAAPGNDRHPAIEPAPGRYVKQRAV